MFAYACVGHEGMVKGVAWDPMGTYLASQGDDAVVVWRREDWSTTARISAPLQEAVHNNFHARLCWSPDGQFLATAASFEHPSHVSALIKRGDWGVENSFVGHSNTVVAVRFNPRFFFGRAPENAEAACTCAALASQDKRFTGNKQRVSWL